MLKEGFYTPDEANQTQERQLPPSEEFEGPESGSELPDAVAAELISGWEEQLNSGETSSTQFLEQLAQEEELVPVPESTAGNTREETLVQAEDGAAAAMESDTTTEQLSEADLEAQKAQTRYQNRQNVAHSLQHIQGMEGTSPESITSSVDKVTNGTIEQPRAYALSKLFREQASQIPGELNTLEQQNQQEYRIIQDQIDRLPQDGTLDSLDKREALQKQRDTLQERFNKRRAELQDTQTQLEAAAEQVLTLEPGGSLFAEDSDTVRAELGLESNEPVNAETLDNAAQQTESQTSSSAESSGSTEPVAEQLQEQETEVTAEVIVDRIRENLERMTVAELREELQRTEAFMQTVEGIQDSFNAEIDTQVQTLESLNRARTVFDETGDAAVVEKLDAQIAIASEKIQENYEKVQQLEKILIILEAYQDEIKQQIAQKESEEEQTTEKQSELDSVLTSFFSNPEFSLNRHTKREINKAKKEQNPQKMESLLDWLQIVLKQLGY